MVWPAAPPMTTAATWFMARHRGDRHRRSRRFPLIRFSAQSSMFWRMARRPALPGGAGRLGPAERAVLDGPGHQLPEGAELGGLPMEQ